MPDTLVRLARYQKGYTQRDLADLLGSTQLEISRWENDHSRPSNYYQVQLAVLLDILPVELVLKRAPLVPARLRAAGILPAPPLESAIPLPYTSGEDMVGQKQKAQLDQLGSMLKNSRGRECFALSGLPGIGKTMMACAVANAPEIQEQFTGGVLWIELGPAPAIEELLRRAAPLVGVDEHVLSKLQGPMTVANAACRAIHTKSMLIIIDDAWSVEDALAVKIGGPYCSYLLTTRFPQVALKFSSDPCANVITLQELEPESGLAILEHLAPIVVRSERHQAKALVQAVGAHPMALALIGNYLHIQASFGQQRRLMQALIEMGDPRKRLRLTLPLSCLEKRPGLADMPHSLENIIKMSDIFLDEKARWALRALSIFPTKPCRFSEKAAIEVAACTAETLDCLVDAGLIECAGNDRYTMHPVIADYAQQAMIENRGVVVERLVRYALAHLDEATASSSSDEQSIMIAAFEEASELALWDKLAPQLSVTQKRMLRKLLPSPRGHTTVVPLHGTRFLQSLETGGEVGLNKLGAG